MRIRISLACIAAFLTIAGVGIRADDWPEIRGKGRLGVWNETGILEKFPEGGLKVLWRTPVGAGYTGPSVANGRVFLMDYRETQRLRGIERALALDEKTGKILWTQEWPAKYGGISWPVGPRATPTVDGDRVYVVGADGKMFCLSVKDGSIIWKKDYAADYKADHRTWAFDWGFASSPLVDGERLICLVGGSPDAKVVAFDKMTGKEIWRALTSESDIGVAQPIIIDAGGGRQLIIWYPGAVASLDPVTGKILWQQPYKVGGSMTVALPVQHGSELFLTTFYDGPLMLTLDDKKAAASVLWKGKSDSEILTDGLHAVLATPVRIGDYIYGICSYGVRSHRAARRSPLHQQRSRGAHHRRAEAGWLPRDQPHLPDQADFAAGEPPGTGQRELVAPRVRQQAHLRAQRRGNHLRLAGGRGQVN
jgi:outer membrane protein assembly factor BamB